MVAGLTKADPWIHANTLGRNAVRHQRLDALPEIRADIDHHIVIVRVVLHRPRIALHMHHADIDLGVAHDRDHARIERQRRDVIDHRGPGSNRRLSDCTLFGVDRDLPRRASPDATHHVDHSTQLLLLRDRLCTWASRFATNINELGTLLRQQQPLRNRCLTIIKASAIRERVGRHIDDTHQSRAGHTTIERIHRESLRCPATQCPKQQ